MDPIEELPCGDEEYAQGMEYLSKHCAAFQRYRREAGETMTKYLASLDDNARHDVFMTDREIAASVFKDYADFQAKITGIAQKGVKP